MGPGNIFSEDQTGQKLYVNTPKGPVQVGQRPTPEEEKRDEKIVYRIASVAAVVCFLFSLQYLLSDFNMLVYDNETGAPILWDTLTSSLKILSITHHVFVAAFFGAVVWTVTGIIVIFYLVMRKANHRKLWRALKDSRPS